MLSRHLIYSFSTYIVIQDLSFFFWYDMSSKIEIDFKLLMDTYLISVMIMNDEIGAEDRGFIFSNFLIEWIN